MGARETNYEQSHHPSHQFMNPVHHVWYKFMVLTFDGFVRKVIKTSVSIKSSSSRERIYHQLSSSIAKPRLTSPWWWSPHWLHKMSANQQSSPTVIIHFGCCAFQTGQTWRMSKMAWLWRSSLNLAINSAWASASVRLMPDNRISLLAQTF